MFSCQGYPSRPAQSSYVLALLFILSFFLLSFLCSFLPFFLLFFLHFFFFLFLSFFFPLLPFTCFFFLFLFTFLHILSGLQGLCHLVVRSHLSLFSLSLVKSSSLLTFPDLQIFIVFFSSFSLSLSWCYKPLALLCFFSFFLFLTYNLFQLLIYL